MTAYSFRCLIDDKGKLAAAQSVDKTVKNIQQADLLIFKYVMRLLNAGEYTGAALVLFGDKIFNPRPEAVRNIFRVIDDHPKALIQGCGSVGKCLAKGTGVMMSNGDIKPVEEIVIGDRVMGDDSGARTVLSLARGISKMFRVIPSVGEPWVCNEDHVLSLRCTENHVCGDGKSISSNYTKGKVIDIPVKDFAKKSKTFREKYKQFFAPVNFSESPVEFDPYIYGLWIGDGGVNLPVLHNADPVLVDHWWSYFSELDYRIYTGGENKGPCRAYYCRRKIKGRNPFKDFVRGSYVNNEKRIRPEYLKNSIEVRLSVLAGIIDTDGWSQGSAYCVATKFSGLADDLVYLARSLGFQATKNAVDKSIKSLGFTGRYFTVYIGGDCNERIPTKLKKCRARTSNRDWTATSIKVEELPEEEYFGFSVDGNSRFLLGDFTVTHNSYSAIAWLLLDWWRDPEFTNIKIISATEGHARSNTFSTLVKLFKQAVIRMPGILTGDYIGLDPKERKSGIAILAIPVGDDGKGRLQGFHPDPRPKPHPILGPSSRVRVFMDECEEVPLGVWEGVSNVLVSMDGASTIKVIGAYNPKDQTSRTAKNAEPVDGWDSFDIEKGVRGRNEWLSKNGWYVLRIDGKQTENVRERRMIYPGFMGYSGYRELELKDGGNSVDLFTFGRGAYPPEGAIGILISSKLLSDSRGEFVFFGHPVKCAGVDVAVDGRDNCVLTVGRLGKATGFLPMNGRLIKFKEPRMVLQIDQQYVLKKGSTKIVGDSIHETCLKLGISPEYVCIDATGNGSAVYSYLMAQWSEDVLGINFSKPATDIKILEQDQYTPEELYEGIVSEVWFAVARWMEFGFLAIAPGMRMEPLQSELTGRRYVLGAGKKLRVEKKDDYKRRLGSASPDAADSLTTLLGAVRYRSAMMGSMMDEKRAEKPIPMPQHSPVDVVKWMENEA